MDPVCHAGLPRWEDLLVTHLGNVQSGIVKYMCQVMNHYVRELYKVHYLYSETLQWLCERNPEVYLWCKECLQWNEILTVQLVYGILKDTCYVRDIYIIVDLTTCFVLYMLLKDLLYTCYLMICFIHLTWGFVIFTP